MALSLPSLPPLKVVRLPSGASPAAASPATASPRGAFVPTPENRSASQVTQ
jgi:hypothetical protein